MTFCIIEIWTECHLTFKEYIMELILIDHEECNQILKDIIKEINPEHYEKRIGNRKLTEFVNVVDLEYALYSTFIESTDSFNKPYSKESKFNLVAKSTLSIPQVDGWILFEWHSHSFKLIWKLYLDGLYDGLRQIQILVELYEEKSTWKY